MKITNKLNLPEPIVRAVQNDSYSKGDADISVTELNDPPQIRVLRKKHEEEITEDVSERIWSLCGQVIHGILERADETGDAERRLSLLVEGYKLSGGMDRFVRKDSLLQDYKFTTVYKVKGGHIPEEWVKQLNVYAEILRQSGELIEQLQIVAILRDWSKGEAQRSGHESGYPQQQVVIVDIPLWSSEKASQYITERVILHQKAESGNIPPCTKEERWAKESVYAVMKKGMKRAYRLCNTKEAAESILTELGEAYSIEFREGESIRCKSWCPVREFCNQKKAMEET